jgi:hypothetical protein
MSDVAQGGACADEWQGGACIDRAQGGACIDKVQGGACIDRAQGGACRDRAQGGACIREGAGLGLDCNPRGECAIVGTVWRSGKTGREGVTSHFVVQLNAR